MTDRGAAAALSAARLVRRSSFAPPFPTVPPRSPASPTPPPLAAAIANLSPLPLITWKSVIAHGCAPIYGFHERGLRARLIVDRRPKCHAAGTPPRR